MGQSSYLWFPLGIFVCLFFPRFLPCSFWLLNKKTYPKYTDFFAIAKSLQSCPTLCNPIDGSPTGSSVPGILQARILEWVAISFSNAWKWKVKVKSLWRSNYIYIVRESWPLPLTLHYDLTIDIAIWYQEVFWNIWIISIIYTYRNTQNRPKEAVVLIQE